jgi:hypothetical protein
MKLIARATQTVYKHEQRERGWSCRKLLGLWMPAEEYPKSRVSKSGYAEGSNFGVLLQKPWINNFGILSSPQNQPHSGQRMGVLPLISTLFLPFGNES